MCLQNFAARIDASVPPFRDSIFSELTPEFLQAFPGVNAYAQNESRDYVSCLPNGGLACAGSYSMYDRNCSLLWASRRTHFVSMTAKLRSFGSDRVEPSG